MTAVPAAAAREPGFPSVVLPELAVPPHVFVLPLPADAAPGQILDQWLEQASELAGSPLVGRRDELRPIVAAACGEAQPGEVAAFLSYREARADPRLRGEGPAAPGGRLVGGAALLTLELLDPMPGSPLERAERLAAELRRTADRLGHGDGLAEITARRTASGVPAVRLRFLALLDASPPETQTPMVEACRWLFPVPGHGDLAWSLIFQTADIGEADELVAEFDQLAASLSWVEV